MGFLSPQNKAFYSYFYYYFILQFSPFKMIELNSKQNLVNQVFFSFTLFYMFFALFCAQLLSLSYFEDVNKKKIKDCKTQIWYGKIYQYSKNEFHTPRRYFELCKVLIKCTKPNKCVIFHLFIFSKSFISPTE